MKIKPIILVAGDPKSIFFEILFKSLKKRKYLSPLILICNKELLLSQMKYFNFKKKIKLFRLEELKFAKLNNTFLNLINVKCENSLLYSSDLRDHKRYIDKSFDIAFSIIKKKLSHKLINGPINKSRFLKKKYPGITEFISDKFKKKTAMLIYNKNLSVSPVTTHLPIKNISKKITKNSVSEKIDIINSFFKKNLKKKPKIAVTCLNPHCESNLNFNEDKKMLVQVIKSKAKKGIFVKGPFPADTIFIKENRKKFDVIIGMYHDQILGPFKTLFEYDAINITIGLNFLRVSPDHGTNEKMFGKNKSNPLSLMRSLEFLDDK